jgi:uncharacterized protein YciI
MKYVLTYESAPDFMSKIPANIGPHRALWKKFHDEKTLLMVGPLTDPPGSAMGIFTNRAAAEAFVAADPFVQNGVVSKWAIREWNEVLVP